MKILMVGFSKTGNTYMFMDYLKQFNNSIEEYRYNKKWLVFGTGNSIFLNFCGAVDGICKILNDTNNQVLATLKYEQRFNEEEVDKKDIDNFINFIKTP